MGAVIARMSLSPKAVVQEVDRFSRGTIVLILGPVLLFGLFLPRLGLIISIVTVALVPLCLSVFVYALSLQSRSGPLSSTPKEHTWKP